MNDISLVTNVSIQRASHRHLGEIIPLVRAYHEFEGLFLSEYDREQSVKKLLSNRSLGGIWRIQAGHELVGYIALCVGFSIEFGGLDAFIDEFYIRPDARNKGIGKVVLELIKDEARKIKIRTLHLEVARTNKKARNLYSGANFKAREKYVLMSYNVTQTADHSCKT